MEMPNTAARSSGSRKTEPHEREDEHPDPRHRIR